MEEAVGDISFDRGEEGPSEDSEAVTDQDIESSNRHNKDNFKAPDNLDTLLKDSPYDDSDKQSQKINAPEDQDQKDDSNYNDANKDVINDHDAQDSANYQDNPDNSDDQEGSCSSDENSNQDTSCSDNFSNAGGEFQAASDNHHDLADSEERGLQNQHRPSYPVDLATFPDDQAVDYSAAFPSNRLTNNSNTTVTAILPKTNTIALSSEIDNVGSKGPCHLVKSFSDFPGFSACLAKNAKQQSESTATLSFNGIARGTDVSQSSSGFNNILHQHEDSSHDKTASAKDPAIAGETLQSAPPSPPEVSNIPSSNDSTPPVTRNSEDVSASKNLETNSETSVAMEAEPIPTPAVQYAFRQLRSRSVALQPSLAMKPRQARGRRRTTSNTNLLNQEGHCQSLPPVSFCVPTAIGSEAISIPVNFSKQDLRPRSTSPLCFSLPVDPQEFPHDRLPSPHQVDTSTLVMNCIPNFNAQASILSEDSSKPTRCELSSSTDGDANLPAHLTPSVSAVSDVSEQCASPSASTSSNDDPVAVAAVAESTCSSYNNLPALEVLPSQQGSGASSKPELLFGRDVINIVPDEGSRCESSETTDESSLPKRKKRMKLKATKKRICKYFSDSSDEEDDQSNVQCTTSFETIADQCQPNSASSSHFTNNASVNTVPSTQKIESKYDSISESSTSDLEMQVDTGAESEADVEPSNMGASNQNQSSSNAATDHTKDVCEDTSQNIISEEHSNVLIDDNLPAVESEVTVESSLIETVSQNTPPTPQRGSSHISATEEPPILPYTDAGPMSNKHAKSTAECEGKQSRRRFKRTKTRLEQNEDAQMATTKEVSGSTEQSASNNVLATVSTSTSTLAFTQSVEEDSAEDKLPDIDATPQQAPSGAQHDSVSDTPAVAVTVETGPTAATSSPGDGNEQQQQMMTRDLLLWKRRLAKCEQLLCESENMTTDTDDSSGCSGQRQVWLGMRDYYRAKIDSVNNGATAATLDGASSSSTAPNDSLQPLDDGNRTKQLCESLPSSMKSRKKEKHRSGSSDRRRRDSASEDQTCQIQQPSVSSTAATSAQQSDGLPAEENDEQRSTSDEAKLLLLDGHSARNCIGAGPSGRRIDDDDAVIVDSDDDDDDDNRADEGGCSSSSRKGVSWRDREWLTLRKRPKHVYRKRRGANKSGADADVVDLTNEVESDPDDGDVEVLQHDKPVVYLETENRRKRRRAARMCAQEGSSASNAAAAQTIDISNNDATPPPPPVDMNDPNILFGMLLDLPKGYQLPLAPSKDEEEERGGGSSNTDGERAARLCQPSGPDLLEAVCIAQESKHPAVGEGGTQAGYSRDATLAGGSSYGPRWGAASTTTPPAFESTNGGYSGAASTTGSSGDLGFVFGAGPSTSASGGGGGGGKLSEKAMHMEKLWEHLNVPAEDIPQCRLRQSVVDLEVPSNFDYDCTNSPPYPSQFASGAGGHGPNSGPGPSSGSDRQSFASSQYGDVGKFESESRATRRRNFAYQPGTSINLAGTSLVTNSGGGAADSNSSALNLLPCNNPFRHSHRLRNAGFLGESSASNPLPEGPSDRLGASTSQANEALDDQGSSSSSSSGNIGHNRSEPVPKLHLIRRSQLWESSSTTPTTSGNGGGGTPMFSRSQSTPIHVSSPLDLSSIPGPSHRRGVFAPPGSLNQETGPSSFVGSTGQHMGDPFGSSYGYNTRHPHGLFGRPYMERVDDDARNAAAVASILPLSSNNATSRGPGNRQNSFDPSINNSGRSMTEYFWLPNLHPEDMTSRNANHNGGSGSGLNNENGRAVTGSSGGNSSRNNNSDVQFLAANLPDSLLDDGTDDEVMPSNVAAHVPAHISRGSNPSTSDAAQRGGGRGGRGQPSYEEPQPSAGPSHTPFHDQPPTSSGGGDSGNNMEISCPICLDTLTEIKAGPSHLVSTVCGHLFCNGCLEPAVRRTKQCPTCRRKLTKKQYHKVYL